MTVFIKIIKCRAIQLAALLFAPCIVHAASEAESSLIIADWSDEFAYGYGNYASLTVGKDNQDNQLIDAFLYLPVGEYIMLDAGASRNDINDVQPSFTTKSYRYGIGSANPSGLNLHVGASTWGNKETIETADVAFDLSYKTTSGWRTGVQHQRGDVTLFIKPLFSSRLTSITSDRSAWGLNTSYTYDKGTWWLSYVKKDYELDLAALNSSFVLQLVLQSIALDQAYALSSDEYNLGYEWFFEHYDLGIQFSRVTSVVDNSDSDYLALSHRYYVNETFSLETSAQNSLDENLLNLSIGLGVNW